MNSLHCTTNDQAIELMKLGFPSALVYRNHGSQIQLLDAFDWLEKHGIFISLHMNESFTMYGVTVMEMVKGGEMCKSKGWYGNRYEACMVGIEIAIEMLNRKK